MTQKLLERDSYQVRKSLSYMPWTKAYDNGRWVPLSLAAAESKMDQSTLRRAAIAGKIAGRKFRGKWQLRLASFTEFFSRYRGNSAPRSCLPWSKREVEILAMPLTAREAARVLGRTERSVILKRMRMR